ncbi:hypothetical protein C8J55DRAFT_545920 [Lentinula edodes]|uniref:Uncharacterized protein n=1 Tax=Lentinula lateritia TaxID=40482 RepID=A0A9W9B2E6_9AGAR|nr:hypothetical protein C8J55DRAFT_545920 [Lentinula edodes]
MKLSVQPIIYVVLGSVISAVHAVPVVLIKSPKKIIHFPQTSGAITPGPHLETRAPSKDIINISFHNPSAQRGTGTPVSKIKTEMKTILTEWRKSDYVSKKPKDAKNFELKYANRYDDNVHLNLHGFSFWGSGVGEECKEEEDGCYVQYEQDEYRRDFESLFVPATSLEATVQIFFGN